MRRLTVGDLSRYGLPAPAKGPFQRLARTGEAPAVVDRAVLAAITSGRLEVVAAVTALDEQVARLADGTHADVDAIVAATGYNPGLQPLVGHLGVLDDRGRPRGAPGGETAPGLRFVGFHAQPGQLGAIGHQARRIARAIDDGPGPPPDVGPRTAAASWRGTGRTE